MREKRFGVNNDITEVLNRKSVAINGISVFYYIDILVISACNFLPFSLAHIPSSETFHYLNGFMHWVVQVCSETCDYLITATK